MKGSFLVNELIWALFKQTGNIETYLLLKQIENAHEVNSKVEEQQDKEIETSDTNIYHIILRRVCMLNQMECIVLKTRDYGETHKIITIFTKKLGIISAICRGANKPKSKLTAVAQNFIEANFLIYVTKGLSTVQQGQILASHRHIREDIIKTGYTAYIIEITDKILETRSPQPFLYDQLKKKLKYINTHEHYAIPVIMYELKM